MWHFPFLPILWIQVFFAYLMWYFMHQWHIIQEHLQIRFSICWTNCQDSMNSVAPFLIHPPGLCSIATWDCSILWRMNASHSKLFPFFYTAFLLKLLWQMKYVVSCRSSKECPNYFLGSSYSIFSTIKSTALTFYSNVWCPRSAILSVTSSILFVISFQVQKNKKEVWFWNLSYDLQHNSFLEHHSIYCDNIFIT
jgi:hypothetical protein